MRIATIVAAFGLPVAFVTAKSTVAQLQDVHSSVMSMDSNLRNWSGNMLALPSLRRQAQALQTQIKAVGQDCTARGGRTADEDRQLLDQGKQTINLLGDMMKTATDAKPKFANVPLGTSAMYGILKSFHTATDGSMVSCLRDASPEAKPQFEALQADADKHFTNALDAYSQVL